MKSYSAMNWKYKEKEKNLSLKKFNRAREKTHYSEHILCMQEEGKSGFDHPVL